MNQDTDSMRMIRARLAGCALAATLLGTALAQSSLDYGLYRAVSVNQSVTLKRVSEASIGETLVWMGTVSVKKAVNNVVSTLPVPDQTVYAGGLSVPAGTQVTFSVDGQRFGTSATTRTRFVRATLPFAAPGQVYRVQFKVQVTPK